MHCPPDLRPMLEILHTQVTMIMMTIALFFENINNLVVGILRIFSRRPGTRIAASLPFQILFALASPPAAGANVRSSLFAVTSLLQTNVTVEIYYVPTIKNQQPYREVISSLDLQFFILLITQTQPTYFSQPAVILYL